MRNLYKNDKGFPFEATDGQAEIFGIIYKREYPRVHISCYTQYGKTSVVSMAVLTRAATFPEKWPIIAPTEKKARIDMTEIIKHLFENEYTRNKVQIEKGEALERLRRERSKNRLTFRMEGQSGKNEGIGDIFILSAQGGRTNPEEAGDSLMGFGAPNLIEDESALIMNSVHSKAMRMLGGHKDNFLVKIGNPFRRNHFLKSSNNEKYYQIIIDGYQGIKEGRITEEFLEEMRDEDFFDILYECKFPKEGVMSSKGWRYMITEEEFAQCVRKIQPIGTKRLGVDVAEGGDENVFVVRTLNHAWIDHKDRESNLMITVGNIIHTMKDEGIEPEDVFVDATGLGAGVASRLKEKLKSENINAVKVGSTADDPEKYVNCKAELGMRARKWLREGGTVSDQKEWDELKVMQYRIIDSNQKTEVISKKMLLMLGIDSPNVYDAFVLTFFNDILHSSSETRKKDEDVRRRYQQVNPDNFDPITGDSL